MAELKDLQRILGVDYKEHQFCLVLGGYDFPSAAYCPSSYIRASDGKECFGIQIYAIKNCEELKNDNEIREVSMEDLGDEIGKIIIGSRQMLDVLKRIVDDGYEFYDQLEQKEKKKAEQGGTDSEADLSTEG